VVFLTVAGGLTVGRAELVTRQPDSIFDVDGLMVDNSESEAVAANGIFRAGIKQSPRMDARKPITTPQPSRIRSPIQRGGLAQELAARFNGLCVQIALGETDIPMSGWDLLTTADINELANWLDADKQDYVKALRPEGYKRLCDIVLGPGTDARMNEIVGLLKSAGRAFKAGQWADSEAALSKVKNAGVRAVGVDVDIGRCLYEKGDKGVALAHFKALVDQYPKAGSVLYDYAYVLINMDLFSQAGEVLERVCMLNPQNGQAAFALACAYAARGQMDKAWPILTRLVSSHAFEMPAWLAGDKPYLRAIRKDPRYAELQKSIEAARQGVQ